MQKKLVWLVALSLLIALALTVWGQAQACPEDTGAFQKFKKHMDCCFDILKWEPHKDCLIPSGWYGMYYSEHPNKTALTHDFGWYAPDLGCEALFRILDYRPWNGYKCKFVLGSSAHHVLPCHDALGVRLSPDGPIGFWLNWPIDPVASHAHKGGLYFTCPNRNLDGKDHAFIYEVTYELKEVCDEECEGRDQPCRSVCGNMVSGGTMYWIFWENTCSPGSWDWNDFAVALIPLMKE
jgi:hypothetical protein